MTYTMEDMLEKIDQYCTGRSCCADCEIKDICNSCGTWDDDPELTKQAFEILTGETTAMEDNVNHPKHYTDGGMECIDEMLAIFGREVVMNFCLCNVWKYRRRALSKNGAEDMEKSHWYMKKYYDLRYHGGESREKVR